MVVWWRLAYLAHLYRRLTWAQTFLDPGPDELAHTDSTYTSPAVLPEGQPSMTIQDAQSPPPPEAIDARRWQAFTEAARLVMGMTSAVNSNQVSTLTERIDLALRIADWLLQ